MALQVIVRVSLLSIDGMPLQEAGTPANGAQPTAYPVPKSFESLVKLAVLTDDTVRDGVRLTRKPLCMLPAASSGFTMAAGSNACVILIASPGLALEHWLNFAEAASAEGDWASQHGGDRGNRCCINKCVR